MNGHINMSSNFEITVFSKTRGILTKKISLSDDGNIIADGSACRMSNGWAERTAIADLHALAEVIEDLKPSQAIALGTLRPDLPDEIPIVSKEKLNGGDAIPRTQENIIYRENQPALVLLDFDRKAMPTEVRERLREFWETLVAIVPGLREAAHLVRQSTSAGLYHADTGERIEGSGGMHGYVMVQDGGDVERFLQDFHDRAWLKGYGWLMISKDGRLLERSIIDRSVGSSERLVFEAAPTLVKPLAQDQEQRRPIVYEGEVLDTHVACPPLTPDERRAVDKIKLETKARLQSEADRVKAIYVEERAPALAERTGKSIEEARQIIESQCGGVLLPDVVLEFFDEDLKGCTVGDVLKNPKRFKDRALADPNEGVSYGRQTAKVLLRRDGHPWIKSFAHGGMNYSLESAADITTGEVEAELERLTKLSAVDYERQRKLAAEKLGFRTSMLDILVRAKRTELGLDEGKDLQGSAVSFPEPEPWPDPVAGDVLLSEIADAIRRYVVMEDHSRDLCALWVVHTYLLDALLITPRLALCSPTKQCGKTTMIDVLTHLVKRPLPTANVSTAAVFRVVQSHQPCLLIDEADTFLLGDNDGLRGILNSGHRRGGSVLRIVGDGLEPRAFSTYGAVAIALIGNLPDTLADRSVIVPLKRKLPREQATQFRLNRTSDLDELSRRAARWATDNAEAIRDADPQMPEGVGNRRADNLLPLLAIADRAGGEWPERSRAAATAGQRGVEEESRLESLLEDIRNIFDASDHLERIASATLVERLIEIEGRPWAEYGRAAKPITVNKLAQLLGPAGIAPEQIRFTPVDTRKGYHRHLFDEAFERFLSQEGGFESKHRHKVDEMGTSGTFQIETSDPDVSIQKSQKSNNDGVCCGVTVQKGEIGKASDMSLDDAAAGTLAARYVSIAYHPDGLVKNLDEADADLRRALAEMGVTSDRIEAEFERVRNIVASDPNPGPKPDRD
jgi:hypothetical protein